MQDLSYILIIWSMQCRDQQFSKSKYVRGRNFCKLKKLEMYNCSFQDKNNVQQMNSMLIVCKNDSSIISFFYILILNITNNNITFYHTKFLITILHYRDDTMGCEKIMTTP